MSNTGSVFVTGAGAGIGAATARALAADGFTVFAGVHHDRSGLEGVSGVRVVQLDVTDAVSVAAAVQEIATAVGSSGLQALVNNAGVIVQGPQELLSDAELRRQFEVNTFGPATVTRHCLPLLRAGRGRVVNISAPTARTPLPFLGPIGASKAALASLSDALRLELSPWRIPVVLVEPGGTATDIFTKAESAFQATVLPDASPALALYSRQLDALAAASARQRLAPADTVARLIVSAVTARRPRRRYTARNARLFRVLSHLPAGLRERAVLAALGLRNAMPAEAAAVRLGVPD
jgi:NAD(P)-dependent dehydrogenase (short-subunit alcohol dehydrogenase family)